MKNKFAIIVAGGSGSRMKSALPKQFLLLNKQPIIVNTINKFLAIKDIEIIVVVAENSVKTWLKIHEKFYKNNQKINWVLGGETRFQSVKNGLNAINEVLGLVAVHDAVRPLVSQIIIEKSFEMASQKNSSVVYVNSKDSIRFINDDNTNMAVNRSNVKLIQTPQTFDLALLKDAYNVIEKDFFTDDASIMEFVGHQINLLEGEYSNIKITTPEDLILAKIILKNESNNSL